MPTYRLPIYASKVEGTHSNFVWLLTHANLPPDIFTVAKADGGDIRLYADAAKTQRLPLHIDRFDKPAGQAAMHTRVAVDGSQPVEAGEAWIEYDGDAAKTQPAGNEPFGSQAVFAGWDVAVVNGRDGIHNTFRDHTEDMGPTYPAGTPVPDAPWGGSATSSVLRREDPLTVPDRTTDVLHTIWFKVGTRGHALTSRRTDSTYGWLIFRNSSKIGFQTQAGNIEYPVATAQGQWLRVDVIVSGGSARIYLDGDQTPGVTASVTINSAPTTPYRIGARGDVSEDDPSFYDYEASFSLVGQRAITSVSQAEGLRSTEWNNQSDPATFSTYEPTSTPDGVLATGTIPVAGTASAIVTGEPLPFLSHDTFTGTDGDPLAGRAATIGGNWQAQPGIAGSVATIQGDRLAFPMGVKNALQLATDFPNRDYTASCDLVHVSNGAAKVGPIVHAQSDAASFYWVCFDQAASLVRLYLSEDAVLTEIGSAPAALAPGETKNLRLQIKQDTSLSASGAVYWQVWWGGEIVYEYVQGQFFKPAGSRVGLMADNGGSGSASVLIDNFTLDQVEVPVVRSLWMGNPTPDSIRVSSAIRQDVTGSLRLAVSISPAITNPVYSAPVTPDPTHHYVRASVSGLQPATQYYCAWEIDGAIDPDSHYGSFRTAPVGPASFKLGLGSCNRTYSNRPIWDRIADQDLDLFQHMGDVHYRNIDVNDETHFQERFDGLFFMRVPRRFWKAQPVNYIWDDHDYGPNDSDANSVSRPAAVAAYRNRVPSPLLAKSGASDSVEYSYVYGRVRFIVMDTRSNKTSGTMIGAAQRDWVITELAAAKAAGQAVVLVSTMPFVAQSGGDHWGSYANNDRIAIANAIRDNGLEGQLCIVSGDMHALALSEPANTKAYGGSSAGGDGPLVPAFQAGPLDQSNSNKAGPWSSGPLTGSETQYGVLVVVDDGQTLSITFTGYEVNEETGSESQVLTYSFDATPQGTNATATGSLSLTGAATAQNAVAGGGVGTLVLGGQSTVNAELRASGGGTLPLTGSARVGSADIAEAQASSTIPLSGTASASLTTQAVASGGIGLSGDATVKANVAAQGGGSLDLTGSARVGAQGQTEAQVAGTIALFGAVEAEAENTGTASGTIDLTGSARASLAGEIPAWPPPRRSLKPRPLGSRLLRPSLAYH